MDIKDIYKAKNNTPKEIYRTFISLYYFLLFNDRIKFIEKKENCVKMFSYLFNNDIDLYADFFLENFIKTKNVFFFTLYNQIPIDFLKYPDKNFYLKFPFITFSDSNFKYSNKKFINKKNVLDIDTLWKRYLKNYYNTKESLNKIKYVEDSRYDNFQILFPIKNFFLLNPINKTLFIYENYPIICSKYIINSNKTLTLLNYYKKITYNKYKYIIKPITLINLKYITVLENITKEDILKCFKNNIIKKNTYLYHQNNTKQIIKFNKNYLYSYYTLTPYSRISDPLYFEKKEKYLTREYITIKDIHFIDISTNIYLNNILTKHIYKNSVDGLFSCFNKNIIKKKSKLCNYEFVNPKKNISRINYNRKQALLLIIWKNMKYIDKEISFITFLELLGINSYFNIMSLVETNNGPKILGEEIYIKQEVADSSIKPVMYYQEDISKFHFSDKDYKNLYY